MTQPETAIDRAHAAMQADPANDEARLAFYEQLAETEVFVLLEAEAADDAIAPRLFPVEGGNYVLVFDLDLRLAVFVGEVAATAALPGRALVQMLAGQGIGIALNLDVAPSAMLIPATAVDWLARVLDQAPEATTGRPVALAPPQGLPATLLTGLARKLGMAAGLAQAAFLAGVTYEGGVQGHLLAFVDARPGAEPALAAAVGEALTFSGLAAGMLDVTFVASGSGMAAELARVGLRLDLPLPAPATAPSPGAAPGTDPAKPPRLR